MRGFRVWAGLLGVAVAAATVLQHLGVPPVTLAQDTSPDEMAIIGHLNTTITWYKALSAANESAGQPSDTYYLDNARDLAKQVVVLAFQSAEAEAALLSAGKAVESPSSEQQNLTKAAADATALSEQTQAKIDLLNSQIPQASGRKRQDLIAQRDTLQGQLEFNKALQEGVQKLSTFTNGNIRKAGGLRKQIDDLKTSVPDLFAKAPSKGVPSPPSAPPSNSSPGTGLLTQMVSLFSSFGDLREINQLVSGAGNVREMANQLHTPLRAKLHTTIAQGHELANQTPPPTPATMEEERQKINALTAQFKQISSAAIPLSQEIVLLGEIQGNLGQWEVSVHRGYIRVLESVIVRISILLIAIGVVLGLSEVWRKATFRYVRESRRRHQLLLLRRFVTGALLAIVLIMGFVTEFGSLATFAGFLTAGIAVALQTIILSVAAYFFLLGSHGVRVGDRVTVSGVTGDVIDVGLVRLSLMELGGSGSDVHPTGRLVVVSNAVLFQGTLFKQIPGTAYTWHELAIKLSNGSDYAMAEKKMLEAVNSIYSQYRASLEQQQQVLEGFMAMSASVPSPQTSLQLGDNGLDLIVRYPVVLHRETEIDNQMAKKVMEAINSDPVLKAAVGTPTIRPSFKVS
jgi:small-conductance mechanosensitive channel